MGERSGIMMKKRWISALLSVLMLVTLLPVTALGATITNSNDSRINTALSLIDSQNFSGSGTTASDAKSIISHFISGSSFAAIGGGKFPYSNSGSYVYSINDGTYSRNITGAKGCMAYCNYLERVVYGREGSRKGEAYHTVSSFKELLQKNAQAGEHIRIDNTHSLTFISCDNDGFYCFSYNGDNDPYIKLQYRTYSSVINDYSGKKIWIYNDNTAENSLHNHSWATTTQNDAYTHNMVCSCGAVIGQQAHNFGSWTVTKAATEQSAGTRVRSCKTCGYQQTETIPATGHTITYNANGGYCSVSSVNVPHGGSIANLPTPTRDGYTFEGWYTAATGGTRVSPTFTFEMDATLYARWISNHIHAYGATWHSDVNYHWHACSCGEIADLAPHTFDNSTCSICGYVDKTAPDDPAPSGGCYVATCVYGSYDCPEVWTLRRFRDETLAKTWYGRAFIHTYYAISPTIVKWFGDTDWFKNMWRGTLDKMVANLNAEGVPDTPYADIDWT